MATMAAGTRSTGRLPAAALTHRRPTPSDHQPRVDLHREWDGIHCLNGVEDRQRAHSRCGRGRLEPHRAPRVVDHEMEPLQPERIHRGLGEAAETGEGEIEVHRPIGQAETGQVERHRPEATSRQLGDHLAVEERRRRQPVGQDNRLTLALRPHEAHQAGGLEQVARRSMRGDHLLHRRAHPTSSPCAARTRVRDGVRRPAPRSSREPTPLPAQAPRPTAYAYQHRLLSPPAAENSPSSARPGLGGFPDADRPAGP